MRLPKLPPHYYFVPFGREPGGFLEALNLPPTATETEINGRYASHMEELEGAYLEKRRPAKAKADYAELLRRRDEGEITEQEFEAAQEALVFGLLDTETKAALDLLHAREERAAEKLNAKKFKSRLRSITQDVGFRALYTDWRAKSITDEELEAGLQAIIARLDKLIDTGLDLESAQNRIIALLREQPLTLEEFADLDAQWKEAKTERETEINKLKKQWDQRESIKRKAENSGFAYDATTWFEDTESKAPLNDQADALLRAADVFWARISGTGRAWWMSQQNAWLTEFQALGPTFALDQLDNPAGASSTARPLFPNLSKPTNLAIDELKREEVADLTQMPQRAGDAQVRNIGDLLAELQRRSAEPRSAKAVAEEDQAPAKRAAAAELLAELLNAMAQAERQQLDD